MIKIAICDDERLVRKQLENIITLYFQERKLECEIRLYGKGKDLLNDYEKKEFSFILLDIDLKSELNGLDIARKIRKREKRPVLIVFITSYYEYQSKVFSIHTFDYVIKPFKNQDINRLLDDLLYWVETNNKNEFVKKQFKTIDGIISIDINDILYFEYYNRRINIVTKNSIYYMYGRMRDIAEMMLEYHFEVPHVSYIINLQEIKMYLKNENSIIMNDDKIVPISQLKLKNFRKAYMKYINNYIDRR